MAANPFFINGTFVGSRVWRSYDYDFACFNGLFAGAWAYDTLLELLSSGLVNRLGRTLLSTTPGPYLRCSLDIFLPCPRMDSTITFPEPRLSCLISVFFESWITGGSTEPSCLLIPFFPGATGATPFVWEVFLIRLCELLLYMSSTDTIFPATLSFDRLSILVAVARTI